MSLINRGALPQYNAVEQRMLIKKKAFSLKTAKKSSGPTKRYARKKVKR